MQTQIRQTHYQANLIWLTISIINAEEVIKKVSETEEIGPYQIVCKVKEKLLTTAYKSEVRKSKLDKDSLHHQIYFLTFMVSLELFYNTRTLVRYL